ncbi:RibD family protein [Micromonospora olivasterospora]|uniref:RibD family protein n=1 Tax=Micromonospora olivasterospora TaxID=1880 RepID=UPI0011A08BE9|nr:dihydrofolate reductase family protein [Micromonospora olivasterospora]
MPQDRPYVLLSCAMSIDGYIDDATDQRLLLSNEADLDRVDAVRAGCDAILVGAGTVRLDDPRLVVRSPERQQRRVARGLPPSPTKVTVTATGDLDPAARFFTVGDAERIVYCAPAALEKARHRLAGLATVVEAPPGCTAPAGGVGAGGVASAGPDAGEPVGCAGVLADLAARGVRRLMVEGGAGVHTQFLGAGLVDELHLVVAPFFVGDRRAPRFPGDGRFPWHPGRRAILAEARQIGDVVLLRYALSDRCGSDPGHV